MLIPDELLVQDHEISVSVAGPGFGEGLLITIGKSILLGIDSCLSLVHRKRGELSFLEERLNRLAHKRYCFWVLTHFHHDHFQSLSAVFDQLNQDLHSVILPLGYTEADIKHYLALEAAEATGESSDYYRAGGEYDRIRRASTSSPLRYKCGKRDGISLWFSTKLKDPSGKIVPLAVHLFGPEELDEMMGQSISSAFHDAGRGRSLANRGSYIVYIRCGRFEGIFLGDAITDRIVQVRQGREEASTTPSEVLCVKVAHHGANDGTNEALLDLCCRTVECSQRKYALIAPFKKHNLPQPDVLQLLRSKGFDLLISGRTQNSPQIYKDIAGEIAYITNGSVIDAMTAGDDIRTVTIQA